jgi:hypothetical protein
MGRIGALDRSSSEVGWKLQDVWSEPSTFGQIMTQALLILILTKAGRSQLCFAFSDPGRERVERGASGCPVAKPRNPPLYQSNPGLAETPWLDHTLA